MTAPAAVDCPACGRDSCPGCTRGPQHYIESVGAFLAETDEPTRYVIGELVPEGVLALIHGEPRARKSLAAFELALSAATGTPAFGLERLRPPQPAPVLWLQEEDPRGPTRVRVRRLVLERCGATPPDTLHVSVRRGVNLDEPEWVDAIIADARRLGAKLVVLDAMRRLSAMVDEGPSKVRAVTAVLRRLVTEAAASVVAVHHDVKPARDSTDSRRRGHRASGGDWFAAAECPIHVEQAGRGESLVYPSDYKFSADPAPFTFRAEYDGQLIRRLVGRDTSTAGAEQAPDRARVVEWLRTHGPAGKRAIKAGVAMGWDKLDGLLSGLVNDGALDSTPGPRRSDLFFIAGTTAPESSRDESTRDPEQSQQHDRSGSSREQSGPLSAPDPREGSGPGAVTRSSHRSPRP